MLVTGIHGHCHTDYGGNRPELIPFHVALASVSQNLGGILTPVFVTQRLHKIVFELGKCELRVTFEVTLDSFGRSRLGFL